MKIKILKSFSLENEKMYIFSGKILTKHELKKRLIKMGVNNINENITKKELVKKYNKNICLNYIKILDKIKKDNNYLKLREKMNDIKKTSINEKFLVFFSKILLFFWKNKHFTVECIGYFMFVSYIKKIIMRLKNMFIFKLLPIKVDFFESYQIICAFLLFQSLKYLFNTFFKSISGVFLIYILYKFKNNIIKYFLKLFYTYFNN